jgi:hypothetical protein
MCTFFISYFNCIQWGFDSRPGQEFFLFYETFKPDMGPKPPQLNRYWGFYPLGGVKGSVNLTNHLYSMKLGMSGALPLLSNSSSWCVA